MSPVFTRTDVNNFNLFCRNGRSIYITITSRHALGRNPIPHEPTEILTCLEVSPQVSSGPTIHLLIYLELIVNLKIFERMLLVGICEKEIRRSFWINERKINVFCCFWKTVEFKKKKIQLFSRKTGFFFSAVHTCTVVGL